MDLYDRIVDKNLLIRRLTVAACRLTDERNAESKETYEQLDLFTDYSALQKKRQQEEMLFEKREKDAESRFKYSETLREECRH
ncbi:MAG: hypothetical protein ACFWTJ_03020 [Lachnoclostridium sp.]